MLTGLIEAILEFATLVGTVFILLFLFGLLVRFVFHKKYSFMDRFGAILHDNYLFLGFLVSFIAVLGSLFYSEVLGYSPCALCWYQRILIYPQVLLFLIAMKNKGRGIVVNSFILSLIGLLITIYQYFGQIGDFGSTICNIGASCSTVYTFAYGFITIPWMGVVAFSFLVIFSGIKLYSHREVIVRERVKVLVEDI